MQVSITKAAEYAGVSRQTIYNDMDSGKLSYEIDGKNKKVINISELERAYGALDNTSSKDMSKIVKTEQSLTNNVNNSDIIELAVLKEKMELIEKERNRERSQFEDRINNLEETLNKAQDNQNKTTLLLEHYTKSDNDDSNEWQKSLKAMEARMSNQETAVKEEKDLAQKIMRQNQILRRKLEEEKNKSFWKKLFG